MDLVDALASNIKKLPGRVVAAGEWLVGGASDAVGGAADTAGNAVGGFLSRGLGPVFKPLAIGAAILGGAFVVVTAAKKRRSRRA